jgi:hypothetical protein
MSSQFVLGSPLLINTGNDGNLIILTNADPNEMGALCLQFDAVSGNFAGSLTVQARSQVSAAQTDKSGAGAAWLPAPHRPGYLNGAVLAVGSIYVFTYAPITGSTLTLVPASGQIIALAVSCTSGSGKLYVVPVVGESAIG